MTFQEAFEVVCYGRHDNDTINKAVSVIEWYEDNVLELEDYETDQLYKALRYIRKNNLGSRA